MGEKRKLYEQVRKDLAAIQHVKSLLSSVDSIFLDKEKELDGILNSIGPDIGEARHEFEKAKRRYQMASELSNDYFFDRYIREALEKARDISFSELAARKKVWNEL